METKDIEEVIHNLKRKYPAEKEKAVEAVLKNLIHPRNTTTIGGTRFLPVKTIEQTLTPTNTDKQ